MTGVSREGDALWVPGLVTVHSHAFQRILRGRTERRSTASTTFWSWRDLMYAAAERLDPDTLFAVSRFAFAELLAGGFTTVGEFHYVHHQPGGTPYADRNELAHAVIRAALDAGIRMTFLRVFYERAGAGRQAEPGQRRFVDPRVEDGLEDLEALCAAYVEQPTVRFGVAPHSVRAVTRASLQTLRDVAARQGLPLHMHVSEQRREVEECVAEHGRTPLAFLDGEGLVGDRFVAVHGTHLTAEEISTLGQRGAFVCLCRTTERNLGDGFPDVARLRDAGVRVTVGTDSHASADPFEELRAIELDERARTERRLEGLEAEALLRAGTVDGLASLGWADAEGADRVMLDGTDPSLVGAAEGTLVDAVIFGASLRAVREVWVGGQLVVDGGKHVREGEFREAYLRALDRMGLPAR